MTGKVFCVTPENTVPQCMALMNEMGIHHLPVMESSRVIGVLSNRDLLKEVVSHHEHVIHDMELERMITLNPDPSSY